MLRTSYLSPQVPLATPWTVLPPRLQFRSANLVGKVTKTGVGLDHYYKVTPKKLAAAIAKCLSDKSIRANAKRLGEKLRARDPAAEGVAAVKAFLAPANLVDYWNKFDALVASDFTFNQTGPVLSSNARVQKSIALTRLDANGKHGDVALTTFLEGKHTASDDDSFKTKAASASDDDSFSLAKA